MRKTPFLRLQRAALPLLALAGCGGALAETSPYYIGASQRLTHQSNVYQTSAAPVSDTISQTSLLAGLDQPFGRQRLFANLTASANRYQDQSALDYDGYSARLGLDWSTVGNLSGTLVIDASQTQADFNAAGFNLGAILGDNTTRSQGVLARAQLGGVTRMTIDGSLSRRSTRFDNIVYASRETDIDEGSLGVRYRVGGSLVVGAALRLTQGDYPALGEGYDARNLDLTVAWAASGASSLDARLSLGKTSYDNDARRDFSGLTGSLGWRWQPTGKLALNTSVSRTAGDETLPRVGQEDIVTSTSFNRVSNTFAVGASYQMTAKIALNAGLNWTDARSLAVGGGDAVKNRSNTATLGVRWLPTRTLSFGCDLSRTSRSASTGVTGYDANSYGCYGQIMLR